MAGEQIRSRGVLALVLGVGLAAIAAPAKVVLLPAGDTSVALLVISLVLCFCLAAVGALGLWVVDEASAVRLQRWFRVLEAAVLVPVFPLFWALFGILWQSELTWVSVSAVAFVVPFLVAMSFAGRVSNAVYVLVAGVTGPFEPDDASTQRLRSLGTLMVVVGGGVAASALPLTLALPVSAAQSGYFAVSVVFTAIFPILLGVKLIRVRNVHAARQMKPQMYIGGVSGISIPASRPVFGEFTSITASGIVLGAVLLVVIVLMVVAMQVWSGYTSVGIRPVKERLWWRRSGAI
jgi:hypothetical protein